MSEISPTESAIATQVIKVETTNKELTRNLYLERRSHIENAFIANPPNREVVQLEDGSSIKVLSSIDVLPENLKSEPSPDKLRVAIYVPTLWYTEEPTPTDNREVRLASSILTGNIDVAIQLKAEGMNNMAFKNEDGTGAGQGKVSKAAVDILKRQLEERGLTGKPIEFAIVGYSEGSSQGASIAARIVEKGLGNVTEYVSIGGGGMIGAEDQNKARPLEFLADAGLSVFRKVPEPEGKRSVTPVPEGSKKPGKTFLITEKPDTYYVPSEIIGRSFKKYKLFGQVNEGLEHAVGNTPEPPLIEALNPEIVWAKRFTNTVLSRKENNPIPIERVMAATTVNHDYDALAKSGIPLMFFIETEDTFFESGKVRQKVEELRTRFPSNKIVVVTSDAGHNDPWKNPSGFSYLLEIIRGKSGFRSQK